MSKAAAEEIYTGFPCLKDDDRLKVLIEYGIIDYAKAAEIDMAFYKEKKDKVLLLHSNKISQICYRDHGKEVHKYQTNLDGKKIRKNTEKELIEALYTYYFPNDDEDIPTVSESFELWIKERESNHIADSKTILHNRKEWERYFEGKALSTKEIQQGKIQYNRAEFLDMKITLVKASHIVRHIKYLVGDGNITKATLRNLKTPLIGAFSYAISHDINCLDPRSINLADVAKRCKQANDNERKVYNKEMIQKLQDYLEGLEKQTTYVLAIRLCLNLGCRIGELRAVHWEDYDEEHQKLYIHRQIVDEAIDGKKRVASEKDYMKSRSSAGKREIPLSSKAVAVLEELRKINGEKVYILANSSGNLPITTNRFNENLKKACDAVGIPYYSSHKIRFGVVTSMYEAGIPENVIQKWAGHSNLSTTRHYDRRTREINITPEELEKVFG